MLFWGKDRTKIIHNDLDSISKSVKKLKNFEEKKDKSFKIIKKSQDGIENAKEDILKRAEEEKGKCQIDWKYDSEIDNLARQEIVQLEKLRENLKYYEKEILTAAKSEDLDVALEFIEKEVKDIEDRDRQNEKSINDMEKMTIKERLRRPSIVPRISRTSDGVRWSDIASAIRQLGGWVEYNEGRHVDEIRFPNTQSPIPLSADLRSERLASQIREKLPRFMPQHKIPSHHEIKIALKKGAFI